MAAKDALNKDLFHGTGGEVEGGVVRPERGSLGHGAYGTTNIATARRYARFGAMDENRLFGTVYKVQTTSKDSSVWGVPEGEQYVVDPEGLKTIEAMEYPINRDAV